jgi:hypothetical protein
MQRGFLVFAAATIFVVTGCADDRRLSQLSDFVPTKFSETRPSPLLHAVAVGETTGGAGMFNTADIRASDFATVMTGILRRNALLAAPGSAKWRIDSLLDVDAPVTTLGDQAIKAKIRYVLRDATTGAAAFDQTVTASSMRETNSAGAEVGMFVLVGGVMGQQRRVNAVDAAVRANLDGFLTALAAWDAARQ